MSLTENSDYDDQLMSRISQGDQQAFQKLFDRHAGRALGYARRLLGGDRMKAEDISQSVWMKVIQAAPRYQSRGQFIAWLFTIVRNTALKDIRFQARFGDESPPSRMG